MSFVSGLARLSLVVLVAVALIVAFAYALASALLLPSGGLAAQQQTETEEASPPSSTVPESGSATTDSVASSPPPSAEAGTSMASVSCQRPTGVPADGEPFYLRIGRTEPGSDPIAVAVDLVGSDSLRSRRTVESAVLSADGSLEIGIPDSAGANFVDCLVIAVQRGDRVVFTGN